jgi:hypothetical protein
MAKARDRAALGFSVHTGWAALMALGGTARAPAILERMRVELLDGSDPSKPRFVYHAAQEIALAAAARLVREVTEISRARAKTALQGVVERLKERNYDVVASGIIVANRPISADLGAIVKSHALIHSAEGALFRGAMKHASESLKIRVVEVPTGELETRASPLLGVSTNELPERLVAIGRAAGRPWSKDQRDSFLAALLASSCR